MAEDTARRITWNQDNWTAFLRTASRLYKYPFQEQLLIFAQRPGATACADYDTWNTRMLWSFRMFQIFRRFRIIRSFRGMWCGKVYYRFAFQSYFAKIRNIKEMSKRLQYINKNVCGRALFVA